MPQSGKVVRRGPWSARWICSSPSRGRAAARASRISPGRTTCPRAPRCGCCARSRRRATSGATTAGGFHAGSGLLALAAALDELPLIQLAEPHLRALVDELGETASLGVLDEAGDALYLAQVQSPHAIRYASWRGRRVPGGVSALGLALRGARRRPSCGATRSSRASRPSPRRCAGRRATSWPRSASRGRRTGSTPRRSRRPPSRWSARRGRAVAGPGRAGLARCPRRVAPRARPEQGAAVPRTSTTGGGIDGRPGPRCVDEVWPRRRNPV